MRPYLYAHENPNAPVRENGLQFWGHPQRIGGLDALRVLVLHTAENIPDNYGPDESAENIAAYGARMDRPASWHVCCDADTTVRCLPDEAVAFHVVDYNTISLGLEMCTQAWRWSKFDWAHPKRKWHHWRILNRAAWVFARWSYIHRIPLRLLTKDQVDAGRRGVCTHTRLDPSRRTDPGPDFPIDRFLAMARRRRRIIRRRQRRQP